MPIKSLDELKLLRETQIQKVKLRESGDGEGSEIEILVGMATCGIAAGSRTVLNTLVDLIQEENLDQVKVIQVGCMGFCHSEPTVQVNFPGQEPVIYGNVDTTVASEIIHKHIKQGTILDDHILIKSYHTI
jgi:NADP-reducing hydrogenase subunit HndB